MKKTLLSPSWYRVARLKPRLHGHTELHRQTFRGRVWYVLQDHATGRFHRFSPAAYLVIGMMNGRHTLQEIWEQAAIQLGPDVPTQDEIIQLLSQLHGADVLRIDIPPDIAEVADRSRRHKRKLASQSVKNPLAVRLPLIDPDQFLTATLPAVRMLLGWFGALLWVIVVGYSATLAALHWSELTNNVFDRVMTTQNLLILALTYPLVKAIHELGHAYAVKRWGGEVHDIGVMFLVFMPVPYVDASSASAFRDKWQRTLVGAAGILVEIFLAAIAMIAWTMLQPGLPRAFVFNVMLIAGVSTVLFNGNPLLRFDGYYVFSDIIEIPNLGTRANQYLQYLIQRHLFGMRDAYSPATAPGERSWFVVYGLAALTYRLFIMTVIVIFIANQFFIVGIAIAIWAIAIMVVVPLAKGIWFLIASPRLDRHRGRALAVTGTLLALIIVAFLSIPLPYATLGQGVVWVPERSFLRAGVDGFVQHVAQPNREVREGDVLVVLEDPLLDAQVRLLESRVREYELRLEALKVDDPLQAELAQERVDQARAELTLALGFADQLLLRSPTAGRFLVSRPSDLDGRYVKKGEVIGYIVGEGDRVVRAIVPQTAIDLVRHRLERVDVRLAGSPERVLQARMMREVPAATEYLPHPALSKEGGGEIYLDPKDPNHSTKALESLFLFDIEIPAGAGGPTIGGRAYVRFDHGKEPLVGRVYRWVRQLFLVEFNV